MTWDTISIVQPAPAAIHADPHPGGSSLSVNAALVNCGALRKPEPWGCKDVSNVGSPHLVTWLPSAAVILTQVAD